MTVFGTAEICGFKITGFIDDFSNGSGCTLLDRPIYSSAVLQAGDVVFMGFGNNFNRQKIACELLQRGIRIPTLIHPSAVISSLATIGEGCYIGANSVIDPMCRVGRFCIVNNGAVICHQTVIGDAVSVCPGVALGGNVKVEDRVWLGIGSSVIEKITIARDVYVGAGSVIINDITEEGALYFGVPARRRIKDVQ